MVQSVWQGSLVLGVVSDKFRESWETYFDTFECKPKGSIDNNIVMQLRLRFEGQVVLPFRIMRPLTNNKSTILLFCSIQINAYTDHGLIIKKRGKRSGRDSFKRLPVAPIGVPSHLLLTTGDGT